jgi:hypothetical protein
MATIVTTAEAALHVSGFSALGAPAQADLVGAATSTIHGYCGRVLALTTHDELHQPENVRVLRLKQYPVVDVLRLCTGLSAAITLRCTDAAASRATVKLTTTGQGDTLAVTGVSLSKTVSGVTTTTPLLFATYLTVDALATAVNLLSGWAATVGLAGWATADLNPDLGTRGALGTGAPLWAFSRDLGLYDLTATTGAVTLHEDRYSPHRFPDRIYAASGQLGSVRAVYTAGYDSTTMPDALKCAAFILIQAAIQRTDVGIKTSEKNSLQAWTFSTDGLVSLVADELAPYRRRRFA